MGEDGGGVCVCDVLQVVGNGGNVEELNGGKERLSGKVWERGRE